MRREWWEEAQGHIWVVKVEVRRCGCQSLREESVGEGEGLGECEWLGD